MAFDPIQYKTTTRRQWEDAAAAWHRWRPLLESWLGPATDRMLDGADVRTGSAVLDVAAGGGGQTLAAARRAGSSGRVLATDISPTILTYAAKVAAEAGCTTVETAEVDGETLDGVPDDGFDAVISRVGLIYLPDQRRALENWRRVLRDGGRVSTVVYSTPDRNEFFSIPVSIIRDRAQLPAPAPGQPGPFSLGTPGVIEAALTDAGFRDVSVECVPAPLHLESAEECVRFQRDCFGALHQMLAGVPEDERTGVWDDINGALTRFESANGFVGPCELLVASATG
jgi:SAM-dependent methyltransferase